MAMTMRAGTPKKQHITWAGTQKNGRLIMSCQKFTKGVVIYIEIITLYDHKSQKIGSTYPRRAKQLVLKERAVWLVEGRALQMISDEPSSATIFEEEKIMIDDVYLSNDNIEARPKYRPVSGATGITSTVSTDTEVTEADSLLLYQARQNVKNKQNLIKHIVAYIITWPLLGIFYAAVLINTVSSFWWRASHIISSLEYVVLYVPEHHSHQVRDAIWFINRHFGHGYVPVIWYMIMGAMLAWSGYIIIRIIKYAARSRAKKRAMGKRAKPDPITREYNRLRSIDM